MSNTTKIQRKAKKQLQACIPIHTLTRKEARVVIAQDVLTALEARVFRVGGAYLEGYFPHTSEKELRELLPKMSSMTVCAIGALFAAYVGRWDNFTLSPDNTADTRQNAKNSRLWILRTDIVEALRPFFTFHELNMLESGFGDSDLYEDWRMFFFHFVNKEPGLLISEVKHIVIQALMRVIIVEEGKPLPPDPRQLKWVHTKEGQAFLKRDFSAFRPQEE